MKAFIEKFLATKMPNLASRGLCPKKHNEAISMLLEGMVRWINRLEDQFVPFGIRMKSTVL